MGAAAPKKKKYRKCTYGVTWQLIPVSASWTLSQMITPLSHSSFILLLLLLLLRNCIYVIKFYYFY